MGSMYFSLLANDFFCIWAIACVLSRVSSYLNVVGASIRVGFSWFQLWNNGFSTKCQLYISA